MGTFIAALAVLIEVLRIKAALESGSKASVLARCPSLTNFLALQVANFQLRPKRAFNLFWFFH